MYNIVDFVEDESDYRVNHDDFLNKYQDMLIFVKYVYQNQDDHILKSSISKVVQVHSMIDSM